MNNNLFVMRLDAEASLPTRAHVDDVGYDLYANENATIPPRDRVTVGTGCAFKVPSDCYGRIASRSGLSTRNKIDVGAGVIDKNYRGEVKVCLINSADEPFAVRRGAKIAQLICERVRYPELVEVSRLDRTDRGADGFGSSG